MAQVLAVAGATGTLGRSVVTAARDAGHEVRRIARSTGVDLLTGDGLPEALRGADAVIDCSKPPTLEEQEATRRSEEHTSELQSRGHLVCRLLLEKKKQTLY